MTPRRSDEFRLAFMLLSRLPVRGPRGVAPGMAASFWAWPIVGAVVGFLAALTHVSALWLGLPPVMAAVLALMVSVLVTGAMHEDGLADLADGFGGGRDRARKLEIMRDSRIGSYGVVALILAFTFRTAGIGNITSDGPAGLELIGPAFVGLAAASRALLPVALTMMPPARADGLGRAAAGSDPLPASIAAIVGFLCLMPLGFATAITVAFAMAISVAAIATLAMRQIGGQTGDVMGAMQLVAECAGWAVLASLI